MTCKPETEAQRLERIATRLLAGILANPVMTDPGTQIADTIEQSIRIAKHFIKQLDALAIAE